MDDSMETVPVLQKKEEKSEFQRFNIILGSCLCFICFLFVNFIIGTIYWYQSDMEDRDRIDHRNITISEKLIDYTTNDVIKCTNNHPCYFTCSYVREHFEKTPHECEYKDYLNIIIIIIEVWLVVAVLGCLCSKSKK